MANAIGAVLVIGGGIAGIQASLDCADMGFRVYLVDKEASIGGRMAQLDKTFPTNDCSLCILAPKMVEVANHPNIELLTYSEVMEVSGEAGNFLVKIRRKPKYVDETKCKNCGACANICPKKVKDAFNMNLSFRKSIHIPFPQAIPSTYLIDEKECLFKTKGVCKVCQKYCDVQAINYEDKEKFLVINVGSIILSAGYDLFDPSVQKQFHYGDNPNILTSLEFERMMSASGPYGGHVVRPSDKKEPKRIAWIQCFGSRDERFNMEYCSSVCCMYAMKQAMIVKEHYPHVECRIFHMDLRTVGKGFIEYLKKAEDIGIIFTRCRIGSVKKSSDQISVRFSNEDDTIEEENFDMLILSIGIKPSNSLKDMSKILNIELNEFGFCKTDDFYVMKSTRLGIYLCGCCQAPQDIPDTIIQASSAAGEATKDLASQRGSLSVVKEFPLELEFHQDDEPRIGVFVCHCGINIGGVVNVKEVVEYIKTQPFVVHAEDNLYMCSKDALGKVQRIIKDKNLNRIVVASCTPRTHEPLFQNAIREAGLNKYLFEMANIREHCAWVHANKPEEATAKAKSIISMAVAKSRLLKPLYEPYNDMIQECAIIGGGIAGLSAALEVADQSFQVYLIEKESEFGGLMSHIKLGLHQENPQEFLKKAVERVRTHPKIQTFLNSEITEIEGYIGNFTLTLLNKVTRDSRQIKSGTIIVATGGDEYKPTEYLYGKDKRVIRQSMLETFIDEDQIDTKTIVMIQCVGSRTVEHPYCSRICCTEAIKNAIKVKTKYPQIRIFILFKEISTYQFKEELYRTARKLGVVFIRYNDRNLPIVTQQDGQLTISVYDNVIKRTIRIKPGFLVLSSAIIPNPDNKNLSELLKIPLERSGFFLEAHVKLRPSDFSTAGIFVAGIAHSPKGISESITQAIGAAGRACTLLSNKKVRGEPITAEISSELCIGCGLCVSICPFEAISITKTELGKRAEVIPTNCKGCGTCGSSCPRRAITIPHFSDSEIISQLKAGIYS